MLKLTSKPKESIVLQTSDGDLTVTIESTNSGHKKQMIKFFLLVFFLISPPIYASDADADADASYESTSQMIERQLKELISRPVIQPKPVLQPSKSNAKPTIEDRFAWQNLSNWNRVKDGMSRSQVESILGKPTKLEVNSISYVTLYYQGEKSGAGYVSGNIVLDNTDRVRDINKPVM